MSNMFSEYTNKIFHEIKRKLTFMDQIINGQKTPEEYLRLGGVYPAIKRAQNFVEKYPLNRIVKAQLFNSKSKLFFQDKYFGFVVELPLIAEHANNLVELLNYTYPQGTCLNFFLKYTGTRSRRKILFSVIVPEGKNSHNNQRILESIRDRIIKTFTTDHKKAIVYDPKCLLEFYNEFFQSNKEIEYDDNSFISALIANNQNEVTNDAEILFDGRKHTVFYSKQYPVVFNNYTSNPFESINEDFNGIDINFYYAINIHCDSNIKNTSAKENKIFTFNTALVLLDTGKDSDPQTFIDYFRYNLNWYIYKNSTCSLQALINCLPMQCDNEMFEMIKHSSINQNFPVGKLAQLIPFGVQNEI